MAKDDYDVILYRILVYLYACMKRKIIFDDDTFKESVRKNVKNDQYFYSILEMAQEEGYIDGLLFKKAWGQDKILMSDLADARITQDGIRYLCENGRMAKIGEALADTADIISKLAAILAK